MPSEKTLEKYRLVVDEWFINGFNGTKAYQKYYPKAARRTAEKKYRMIAVIPEIVEYIEAKRKRIELDSRATHDGILNELKNWAYADITETLSLTPEQIKELPESVRRLIQKYKHNKKEILNSKGKVVQVIETVELTFVSKEKAIDMINRHKGFYEADNDQKRVILDIPKVQLIIE